jgi:hypothetical protein
LCGFLLDGRNLARIYAPERELHRLTSVSEVAFEGQTTRI